MFYQRRTKTLALAASVPVVIALLVLLGINIQSTSAATAAAEAKAAKESAIAIALADTEVKSLLKEKKYRVLEVTEGDHGENKNRINVAIYVYSDAKAIGVQIDPSEGKVVGKTIVENSRGPMPSIEEGQVAFAIASQDQRFLDLAGGMQFGYHGHQIVKLDPEDPCNTHRCVSISMDLKQDVNGQPHTHQAIAFVDLVTNRVTGLIIQPGTLHVDVPGEYFVQFTLDDFRGRSISVQEAQKVVEVQ